MKFLGVVVTTALLLITGCDRSSGSKSSDIVLHHQLRSKVQVLDPANIGDTMSHAVGAEIFECLYGYHYLKRPYEIIPVLAADMPEVSEDGLSYTIKIKRGVYFHGDRCFPGGRGREVKASDFVFSWKRIADLKSRSKMWWVFDNRIVGLDEFREYTKSCASASEVDYGRVVEGLRAVDDYTLFIKLKRPWPQIGHIMAFLPTAVVAKEAVDYYGKDIINHPVGTGPFQLKVWRRGSYIEMVRNPNYRDDSYPTEGEAGDVEKGLLRDAGKRIPFVDRIIWRVVTEDQPRWLMFLQGDTDITSIPKDNFGQAIATGRELTEEMRERDIRLAAFQEPDTFYVGMNMEDAVLGENKFLRLAIICAFDREKWIDLFFNGRGVVAHGFIPPNMPGYDPNIAKVSRTEYNPEKGRQLLKQAEEFAGGKIPTLKLTMSGTDTTYRQMGQFLEQAMEDIGLDIEVELLDWPTYLEKLRTKSLQVYSAGWIADYPDVENFLQIFYSKSAPWPNSSNYHNEEFDRIYAQARLMEDSPERTELYRRAERIVVEDAPVAFLYHRIWYAMYHDWIENLKADAYKPESCGYGLSKYYRVNVEGRTAYQKKYK
ncbi:MAG: ABC transporter substrate-binding protein [Planctomycetota bacterium]